MENKKKSVLIIGKFYSEGFGLHIAETLEQMGWRVLRYDPGIPLKRQENKIMKRLWLYQSAAAEMLKKIPYFENLFINSLFNLAKNHPIDLTIVCHDFLSPRHIGALKSITKSPIVLWFPDHISNFGKAYFFNANYDAMFFKDPYIVHILSRNLSTPVYYLPECCNPNRHQYRETQSDVKKYQCDVATAGNIYSYRAAFFGQLQEYKVKIWGNEPPLWMDVHLIQKMLQHQFVANEEKAKAFRIAKIVVNNLQPSEIWGVNARTFEICAAGGFQLVDWRSGLGQLFSDGKELVSFKNIADLKNKIKFYLNNENERRSIAERGMRRALNEHTYKHRLECLLETVFGKGEGFSQLDETSHRTDS